MILDPTPWPNGKRCAVAITWDVDAQSGLHYAHPTASGRFVATQLQLGLDTAVAIPRLLALLDKLDLKQTFFFPGWVMERHSDTVEAVLSNGHEIGLHGYLHERSNEFAKDEEREILERSLAAYASIVGGRPRGWRTPGFTSSPNTTDLLIEAGFDYDSSLMGGEHPYVVRSAAGELLQLPVDWTVDDWPHYMHNRDFNYMMPISSPSQAMEIFRSEFSAAWEYGGLFSTIWHPFLSGRLARLSEIERFVGHMRDKGSVWFARMDEIADHVKSLDPSVWKPRIVDLRQDISSIAPGSIPRKVI